MKRLAVGLLLLAAFAAPAAAQSTDTLALSLEEALERAFNESEEVRLARNQVEIADAQVRNVRAGALPQISGNLGYTRTFASQFQDSGFEIPDSLRFEPDSTASVEERLRYLEENAGLAGLNSLGMLFGNLPFGQKHAYTAAVTGSQLLFSGGRTGAALEAARVFREASRLQLLEEQAQLELDVRTAYYRALFSQELERISEAAVEQAERFLEQERLRESTGVASELDVLRAEVSLANLRPQLVSARNAAELATLDLKRLINVPVNQALALTTQLEIPPEEDLATETPDSLVLLANRAAIQAAERQVRMRELGVKIARGSFFPEISVNMSYGRLAYPVEAFSFSGLPWRTDWTAGVTVRIPIFDGLRRYAELDQARVELSNARLQLAQLREAVQLQYQQAVGERRRAREEIAARQQTVTQAQRVYDLTVLRYERGLATQLEVSDARLALLQARTNLAQALSDYYVAEATVTRALGGSAITTGTR